MKAYDRRVRALYSRGRALPLARRLARWWADVFARGLAPRRWVTLEVVGRRSGRPVRFPLGMADVDGRWFLVSMLGEDCNWVRNVRAADGIATILHGSARPVRLVEVPHEQAALRARVLGRYLRTVPGGRPHMSVDHRSPAEDLLAAAGDYPILEVHDR